MVVLAAFLCVSGLPAMAQEDGSGDSEDTESEPTAEDISAEEEKDSQIEEEEERSRTPRWDGTAARRELLFRDRVDQRGTQYPEGLVPKPGIERNDLEAFDPRQRGRAASLPQDARAGFSVNASLAVRGSYEENPLLVRSATNTQFWGYEIAPKLTVAHRSPRTMFQSVVQLSYDVLEPFEEGRLDNFNSFDQHGGAQFAVYGQRTSFSVFGNIANTTTRTALVEEVGEDLSDDRVLTYGGGGSVTHTVSQTGQFQLSAAGRWQELDSEELSDSSYFQAAADYRSTISRKDVVGVAGLYERFMPDDEEFPDVSVVTGLVNWSHQVSVSMSMNVEGGAQFIRNESNSAEGDDETKVDVFAQASLFWAVTPLDGISLRAKRSAEPNATGETRTTNRFELAYQRQLGRGISLGVPLTAIFQDSALDGNADDRSFFQAAPNLVWAFNGGWGVSAEYRYRRENRDGVSAVSSNSVFLTLIYTGTGWRTRAACPRDRSIGCD